MTEAILELHGGTLSVAPVQAGLLPELCDYASRLNPKRGYLFVSKVLGKHLPVRPSRMRESHEALVRGLKPFLDESSGAFFLGFAETATGLGAGVFEAALRAHPALPALLSCTTRYRMGAPLALNFQEEHSHATGHLLHLPRNTQGPLSQLMTKAKDLVMVDDEMSTGRTSANFLRAFLSVNSSLRRVAMVSILNWMSPARRLELQAEFPQLDITFVSLLDGEFQFTPKPGYTCPTPPKVDSRPASAQSRIPSSYGRLGETGLHLSDFPRALERLELDRSRPVHILADGEFMHPPFLLAAYLEEQGFDVWFQSTTRSPILLGGAVQRTVTFEDHYGDGIPNFAHNLPEPCGGAQIVLCHETLGHPNILDQLALTGGRVVKSISYQELLCA